VEVKDQEDLAEEVLMALEEVLIAQEELNFIMEMILVDIVVII
jgi:hypothetical protein